ncbi:MAG: hypothetical protein IJB26_00295 [Clostridia bacterium]|nr:hypothetical protein [Clostridia bacterium]
MTDETIVAIVTGVVLFHIAFYFFNVAFASWRVYLNTLMRDKNAPRERALLIRNDLTVRMDDEGLAWQTRHAAYKQDVHIVREGLNLYGEYYDLGYDRAVIILSGRTESLRYGYYFAKPYSEGGFNVLVVDSRTHGLSDGEFITFGFEEGMDALAWARFLHETYGIETVIYHGICIGGAAGMLAITSPNCPACVKGLVTEGMFANFAESMKNHLIERKRLLPPIMACIDYWCKKYTGHSMKRGPIDVIGTMDKPLLMLQSKMDKYSTAAYAERMYALCPSKQKQLVLFDEGDHSMLRITDTAKYDGAIAAFIQRYFSADGTAE